MTFTYTDALTTDRDKIRFRIGDTQANAGPRPDKRNFSDEEITFVLTEESSEVNASIAHSFEILTNEWTSFSLSENAAQVSFNAKGVAEEYKKLALDWRKKPGGATQVERSGILVTIIREDAYTS